MPIYSRRRRKSRDARRYEKRGRPKRGDGDDMAQAPSIRIRIKIELRIAAARGDNQAIPHFGAISQLVLVSPESAQNEASFLR